MIAEPGPWTLTETTGLSAGAQAVREALYRQRKGRADRLAGLSPADWAAPTRCTEWSVHEVVRHIVDAGEFHVARLTNQQDTRFTRHGRFDPRSTPNAWLRDSAGQSPEQTLDALVRLAHAEHDGFGRAVEADTTTLEPGPLGRPVVWWVRSVHLVWDAWIHERDMSETLRPAEPPDDAIQRLAALYGLLAAGSAAALSGYLPPVTVRLIGSPDGSYAISETAQGMTVTAGGAAPAGLSGPFEAVLESVTGRGPAPAEVVGVSNATVERLSSLAAVMA